MPRCTLRADSGAEEMADDATRLVELPLCPWRVIRANISGLIASCCLCYSLALFLSLSDVRWIRSSGGKTRKHCSQNFSPRLQKFAIATVLEFSFGHFEEKREEKKGKEEEEEKEEGVEERERERENRMKVLQLSPFPVLAPGHASYIYIYKCCLG